MRVDELLRRVYEKERNAPKLTKLPMLPEWPKAETELVRSFRVVVESTVEELGISPQQLERGLDVGKAVEAFTEFEREALSAVHVWRRAAECSDDERPGRIERAIEAETIAGLHRDDVLRALGEEVPGEEGSVPETK